MPRLQRLVGSRRRGRNVVPRNTELTLEEGLELRGNRVIVITAQPRSTTLLWARESRLVLGGELLMGLGIENVENTGEKKENHS